MAFLGLAQEEEKGLEWFNIAKVTNAKVMKIGIKTNDSTLLITQPYFADVAIFSKKTTDFPKYTFLNPREKNYYHFC